MTTSSPVKAKLPLILRKDNHLCLAVYDEAAADVVELNGSTNRYTGDYREAEVRMNPAHPRCFAHATTTHVRYSEVIEKEDGTPSLHLHFEVEMSYVVVELAFSPLGTYLLAYAMMDTKRTPDGNLSVIEVATGRVVRRCLQARWPAMMWSAMEEYVVRPAQGCLHIMNGNMSGSTSSPTEVEVMNDADAKEDEHGDDAEGGEAPTPAPSSGVLCKLELMLAQDKEIVFSTSPNDALPILALFKPFYKQRQGVFSLYRLPHLQEGPLFQLQFGRSEEAQMLWSPSGKYIALQVKSERDPSGKSYYGITTLHIIDVMNRSVKDIKLNKGEGESIHDCQWAPNSDELLVVHGKMPRNKTTLLDRHGVALLTFSESPRNMACWSPDGKQLALGGSGNLAGHYAFFTRPTSSSPSNAKNGTSSSANAATMAAPDCTGELEEKCSLSTWAPDSHHFLCSTVFTRLRMDNKIIIAKNNGQRMCTKKYDLLYGAEWVEMQKPEMYPQRPPSPRQVVEKAAAYRPPGGGSTRTAELFRRPDAGAAPTAKRAGPVGGAVVMKKKKR